MATQTSYSLHALEQLKNQAKDLLRAYKAAERVAYRTMIEARELYEEGFA